MQISELKEKRIALGYHLENVAQLMKVRASILEHLESSSTESPWDAHDIHTLRSYCALLNLDFNTLDIPKNPAKLQRSIMDPPLQKKNSLRGYLVFFITCTLGGYLAYTQYMTILSLEIPSLLSDTLSSEATHA